ncbi:ribbon-helix-helix domain-containing protein [Thermosynechococcus sp. HN-54]|uniref:ribbon-helix-helix domain-containing protein n=1 Tax=Thermosynechococcus sp. HN-54 TaxID=2933959 RepID=UPI00202CE57C|nr:ribbon-helix-helix domain-containing protein [Thermosynechococcus sp. HN-54]URR35763.1 ribbon-helix-helix domain-containing protein [Thermosynechococcus sp. HN-54]
MTTPQGKRRITVTIDAQLLEAIDRISKNRSATIEKALRLWHAHQVEEQLLAFYQHRPERDETEEIQWAQATQFNAFDAWQQESPWHS